MSVYEKVGNCIGIVLFIVCFPITIPIYCCLANTEREEKKGMYDINMERFAVRFDGSML